MMFWSGIVFFYIFFSLLANLAFYSQNSKYQLPDCFEYLLDVFTDVRFNKVRNPILIIMALMFVVLSNFFSFLLHLGFWWVIIPKKMIS